MGNVQLIAMGLLQLIMTTLASGMLCLQAPAHCFLQQVCIENHAMFMHDEYLQISIYMNVNSSLHEGSE